MQFHVARRTVSVAGNRQAFRLEASFDSGATRSDGGNVVYELLPVETETEVGGCPGCKDTEGLSGEPVASGCPCHPIPNASHRRSIVLFDTYAYRSDCSPIPKVKSELSTASGPDVRRPFFDESLSVGLGLRLGRGREEPFDVGVVQPGDQRGYVAADPRTEDQSASGKLHRLHGRPGCHLFSAPTANSGH
jgi:hypothetical protein